MLVVAVIPVSLSVLTPLNKSKLIHTLSIGVLGLLTNGDAYIEVGVIVSTLPENDTPSASNSYIT